MAGPTCHVWQVDLPQVFFYFFFLFLYLFFWFLILKLDFFRKIFGGVLSDQHLLVYISFVFLVFDVKQMANNFQCFFSEYQTIYMFKICFVSKKKRIFKNEMILLNLLIDKRFFLEK